MKWIKLLWHKLGTCGDTYTEGSETSIFGLAQGVYNHIATGSKITPSDCTTIDVVTSATENTFGDFVKVIDVNSGCNAFSMHHLNIVDISDNGIYVLELCSVNPENIQEIYECLTVVDVARISPFTRSFQLKIQMRNVADGATIAIRAKKSGAGSGTVSFICSYH